MNSNKFSPWPHWMFINLWINRELALQMAQRDIIGRYRGSWMGLLWSFFNPILMLFVYTFVFGVVFKSRWGIDEQSSRVNFAIILFAGLITFQVFSESINRAPALILSNVNLVKKVVFPLDILPWVAMVGAIFHAFINMLVLVTFILLFSHYIHWTVVLLPFVWSPLILFTMGVCWFLAATGVFIRDISQIIGVLTTIIMFLSPVFYPITALPADMQSLFQFNPIAFILEQTREIIIMGHTPEWFKLSYHFVFGFVVAALGFAWFQKSRRGFADVL
jgi:lipopolysaccharide transport system permease protein